MKDVEDKNQGESTASPSETPPHRGYHSGPMAEVTIEQAIELAKHRHQERKLAEAEGIYRQILAAHPDHPEALHLLGVIAAHQGQHETALGLIGRAIGVQPKFPHAFNNLGLTLP